MDWIAGVLFKPTESIRNIIARKPLVAALGVFFLAVWSNGLSDLLFGTNYAYPTHPGYFLLHIIVNFCLSCLLITIFTGLCHFFADAMGGGGSGKALGNLFFLSSAPLLFLLPLSLIHYITGMASGAEITVVKVILGLWTFFLVIRSVQEVYRFNLLKAVGVVALPICLLFGILLFGIFSSLTIAVPGHAAF